MLFLGFRDFVFFLVFCDFLLNYTRKTCGDKKEAKSIPVLAGIRENVQMGSGNAK